MHYSNVEFESILQIGGADLLESRDACGLTPLMVLASVIVGRHVVGRKLDTNGIESLLSLGADKNATDPSGCTPYGLCLASKRNSDDFNACFQFNERLCSMMGYEEVIALLRPDNGMTTADLKANYGVDPIRS